MKRIICAILAVMLLIGMLPVAAFAASDVYIEVAKNNAPLRTKASSDGSVAMRCEEGMVLKTAGSCYNVKFNKWYKVKVPGSNETLFIYSGNVKTHTHKPTALKVNGITYRVCACGNISASAANQAQKNEANAVIGSTTMAMSLVVADGPLPLGDLAAVSVLILGACYAQNLRVPTVNELANMVSEADFDRYFKERAENTCSEYTFRRVIRYPGGLKYIDRYCMDAVEAYVYVRLLQGDVYTSSEDSAMMLAAMFGSAIMERDKASPTKDVATFYFHYHAGADRSNKAHIFFGLNDLGQAPT